MNNPESIYDSHARILQQTITLALASPAIDTLTSQLFVELFERFPETEQAFDRSSLVSFAPKKFKLVSELIVDVFAHPQYAEESIANEIIRHHMYDLKDKEYYFTLADAVYFCVKNACAEDWTEEMEECWDDALMAFKGLVSKATREFADQY